MPTVLAILPEGFEELEAVAPIDLLRRAGAEVTVAALVDGIHVTGRNALTMHADTTLTAVGESLFDLLFLPGGPGVAKLRADPRVRATVLRHHEAGRWLAAICAAPTVLNDAGLLAARLQDLYMDPNRKARRIKRSLCALQHILSRARARCSRCWTQC